MTLTRAERDSFASTTPADIAYGEGACLETPKKVFELLHSRFKFDVDLTANEKNHKLDTWFGPGSAYHDGAFNSYQDALNCDWWNHGRLNSGFSNPPYGPFIPKILAKAIEESAKGFTSVFLLPNRAGGWFQDLVLPFYSDLWYVENRLIFEYEGKPRLSAKIVANKALKADPRYICNIESVLAAEDLTHRYTIDGVEYTYDFKAGQQIMSPAGALFDSIIVVYQPQKQIMLPGQPPKRPNIWSPKTGELKW